MSVRDWKGTAKMTVKKLGEIIGATTDTGGTATAGTLMAKVNALIGAFAAGVTAKSIKSVQRGVITIASQKASATATINAVNMSKSKLVFTGLMTTSSEGGQSTETNLVLTNATTVTATRGTSSYKTTVEIPYQVVEYY